MDRLSITAIQPTGAGANWQTEAMRAHQTPRLLIVTRGQGRITIAGLTSGYGPNNAIYIPAGTMYGFETGPGINGFLLSIPHAMAPEWPEIPVHLRLREVADQQMLHMLVDAMERELRSDKSGHSRAAHYHLGLLSVFIERKMGDPEGDSRRHSAPARLVAAFTDLVERDFRTAQGVADYAAALGVTPTHLTRCCNQTCDRSALAILNDRVLFEARRLLADGDQPVQDIARHLGFTSPAYFTRAFQAHAGQTPTKFRKSPQLN